MERQHTAEDPKKYAWLLQNRWTRLMHTSEIKFDVMDKTIKIDGNLIKNKLSSGGDVIEVRDLYQTTIRIKPQCRLFMMCNDIPPISPPDAVQTLTSINFPSVFLEKEKYDKEKKSKKLNKNIQISDLSIKDFVARKDVCDCYLLLVLDAFFNEKVKNCKKVKEDTDELKLDLGDEDTVITTYFEFTGSKQDKILSSELSEYHKKINLNVSISKLKRLLINNGAKYTNHPERGFIGVKKLEIIDELN
jgi:hypothetical protein